MVALGIEVLLKKQRHLLTGKQVGLVSNYSTTNRHFCSVVDLLIDDDGWEVSKLFGPEHGMLGCAKEGEDVSSALDTHTGKIAYSLYGQDELPTPEMLDQVDILVVDLVDVGTRYYTNIGTMMNCVEACGELGLPVIVLDRPNPIDGVHREGNLLQPGFSSLVGMLPIPNRHGLTMGELASYHNQRLSRPCELTVVRAEGWKRNTTWPETGLPFISPSPNTTNFEMVALYPGTCLIEGTNLSEGRGTTHPFEIVGAPFADGHLVAKAFAEAGLPGVAARPTYFVPTYQKHSGALCQGVQLHVTDAHRLEPVKTGLILIETFAKLYPDQFTFLEARNDGRCFMDLLAGTEKLREMILAERALDYLKDSLPDLADFNKEIPQFYLY